MATTLTTQTSREAKRPRPGASIAIGALAVLCLWLMPPAAFAATESVDVYGSLATIRPGHALPAGAGSEVKLLAARNEFQSAQIAIGAGSSPATGVRVDLSSALTGPGGATIPAGNVTVYREAYYNVTTASDREGGAGEWPDALIPETDSFYHENRDAFPVDLPAGGRVVAWIDILAPADAAAGAYSGSVRVSDAQGVVRDVPVHVNVSAFTLPSTSTLRSAFPMSSYFPCTADTGSYDCNGNEDQRWQLSKLFAEAALNNRVTIPNPFPGVYGDSGAPQAPTSQSAKQHFEQYALPLINGTDSGVRLKGAKLTSVLAYGTCARTGSTCLGDWKQLAGQFGFSDRFDLYLCDEPYANSSLWSSECKPNAIRAAQLWPAANKLVTTDIQDANANGAAGQVDTLAPVINQMADKSGALVGDQRGSYNSFLNPADDAQGSASNQLWMYTSCLSYGCGTSSSSTSYWDGWAGYAIDQPASQAEAMGWLSFAYGATGELYYNTGTKLTSAWSNQYYAGGNGDGTLFYPGTPTGVGSSIAIGGTHPIPIESMRLKRIRDGRQAYEYLHLLEAGGQKEAAEGVVRDLFGSFNSAAFGTTVSEGAVEAARARLTALITGSPVESPTPPTPPVAEPPTPTPNPSPTPPVVEAPAPSAPPATEVESKETPSPGGSSVEAPSSDPGPSQPALKVFRVIVPRQSAKLRIDGVRALVQCTAHCRVRVTPTIDRHTAGRLGMSSTRIGSGSAQLGADSRSWVSARLTGAALRRIADPGEVADLRIKTQIQATPVA
jgi:hypothetical protein